MKHSRFFLEGNTVIGGTTILGGVASGNGLNLRIDPGYTCIVTNDIGLDASVKFNGNLVFGNRGTTCSIDYRLGLYIFLPSRKAMSNLQTG